jgi:hypothetical protein
MTRQTATKKALLIDTLKLISIPLELANDLEIADNLEELEGDAYTFLHHVNILPLNEAGIISEYIMNEIVSLREKINLVDRLLWNVDSFRSCKVWEEIRRKSRELLSLIPD